MSKSCFISVIVPVYNGGYPFVCSLLALKQTQFRDWELIVVDDGSTDKSALIAQKFGAKVLTTEGRKGPGEARNLGAKAARGNYVCFIDADCEICGDAIAELAKTLKASPEIDALFGSYDDRPQATNFIAQYRNLLHHYIHQQGKEEASTFWAGFGVVRSSLFHSLGGFDTQRYSRPSIEDIELGYRIQQAGGRIYLAKHLQVKHHKAWNLINVIKTDIFDRGIPWTLLLHSNKSYVVNDLNLKTSSRISIVAVYSLWACLLLAFYRLEAVIPSLVFISLLLYLNLDLYRFFYERRGVVFTTRAILMHWFYYTYGGFSFVLGTLLYWKKIFFTKTFKIFSVS